MGRRFSIFLFVAVIGCLADLLSKEWIFGRLGLPGSSDTWWMLDGVFGFQTSLNEGGLFGMGQGYVPVLATLSFFAIAAIFVWFFKFAHHSRLLTITLGMIVAGILGNLYDRMGLHHLRWSETCARDVEQIGQPVYAVRDWILVMIGNWPWPNFNIADVLLVCGVGLLMIHTLFFDDGPEEKSTQEKPTEEKTADEQPMESAGEEA